MIERMYMAAETNDERGRQDGPYKSAQEAEAAALNLGWVWVVAYSHSLNEDGTIQNVERRYYHPFRPPAGRTSPIDVEALRRTLSTPDITPLSDEETKFFGEYEQQMSGPRWKKFLAPKK